MPTQRKEGDLSQEIVYTSAPQGIRPGSRGFCTVAATAGIPKNTIELLESFSGYRHAYDVNDPNIAKSPVNYSHLILTIGGKKYHVLSRICDAGKDYTQRSNKLAHHIVLSESERTTGGPAWVLSRPGFCVTKWEGDPRTFPQGRKPDPSDHRGEICRAWQAATGDAGWGGVLAESFLERPPGTVSVLFKPGQNLLPLVVESLALLPEELRWSVTFSTYFTRLPAGVDCHWRFLLDDSPEAQAVRGNRNLKVIDLVAPSGRATGGKLVDQARSGLAATLNERPATAGPASKSPTVILTAEATPVAIGPLSDVQEVTVTGDSYLREAGPPSIPGRSALPRPPRRPQQKKWSSVAMPLVGLVALGAAAFTVTLYFVLPGQPTAGTAVAQKSTTDSPEAIAARLKDPAVAPEVRRTSAPATLPPAPAQIKVQSGGNQPSGTNLPVVALPLKPSNAAKGGGSQSTPPNAVGGKSNDQQKPAKHTPLAAPEKKATNETPDPFVTLQSHGPLRLPKPNPQMLLPEKIAELAIGDPSRLTLRIVGVDVVFGIDPIVKVEEQPHVVNDSTFEWPIAYGSQSEISENRAPTVARFILKENKEKKTLLFVWEDNVKRMLHPERLKYCRLALTDGMAHQFVARLNDDLVEREDWNFTLDQATTEKDFRFDAVSEVQRLQLDVDLPGAERQGKSQPLHLGDEVVFRISPKNAAKNAAQGDKNAAHLDVTVRFIDLRERNAKGTIGISIKPTATSPQIGKCDLKKVEPAKVPQVPRTLAVRSSNEVKTYLTVNGNALSKLGALLEKAEEFLNGGHHKHLDEPPGPYEKDHQTMVAFRDQLVARSKWLEATKDLMSEKRTITFRLNVMIEGQNVVLLKSKRYADRATPEHAVTGR